MSKEVTIVRNVLEANDRLAEELQNKFRVKKILCLNLMSSPGAGKTTLLERTLTDLKDEFKMAVIEGDLQTDNDAQRVAATGAQAVQINTEGGCHLDSGMVLDALKAIDTDGLDILFVENVGNLVCPAEFNVGEDYKVTLLSVTEGDDKPEKYPFMFHISAVMLLNKVDLLPYVDFDMVKAENHAKKLNKDIAVMPISARTGENMEVWYKWLRAKRAEKLQNIVSMRHTPPVLLAGQEAFYCRANFSPFSVGNGNRQRQGRFMSFPKNLPLEDVFASIADGLFTVDTDWNVTYFNEAAERITGVSAAETLGRKCWDVFRSSLCDGQCAIGNCIEKGGRIVNKSIFIVRSDGSTLPISISASTLKDKDGNIIGGVETFRDLTEIHVSRQKARDIYRFENIVGRSQALGKIFRILPQISDSEATTLLLGESGTGKELFAKAIHNLSSRKDGPFVAVNCGALPDTLLESELFGYKTGAFTDAKTDKLGRFELAHGGTVFLDEIGDIPANLQVKLLRFLQDKTFEPLGGVTPVKADVRVVAATNKNLEQAVAEGSFRQDLYYRLNVVTLTLPPLSQRQEDLPLLIDHFLKEFNALRGKAIKGVSEAALHVLMYHDFPGNVRELENILEYAFILCSSGFIQVEHLPEHLHPDAGDGNTPHALSGTMDAIKRRAARQAVKRHNGKKMAACRELDITKDTLRRLLTDEEQTNYSPTFFLQG